MMKKILFYSSGVVLSLQVATTAIASSCYNGWATPTSLKYNLKSLSANNDANGSAILIADPFSVTFKRTDKNFASTTISDVILPFGRYVSLGLCYGDSVDVTLDAVKFDGNGSYNCSSANPLAAGATITTVNATNSDGAIATSGTAVATAFADETGCAITYFPSPICVTDDAQASCQKGDLVYTSTGAADNAKGDGDGKNAVKTSFKINLLVDMYDGVVIDGGVGKILGVPPILAVAGDPGAAIHMTVPQSASGGTVPFNASLLFGSDKKLLSANISQGGGATGGSPLAHSCQGGNNVAITDAPASFPFGRISNVSTTANNNLGQIFIPMVSSCMTTTTCNSVGTEQIDNVFQAVGNSATFSCVDDSSAAFQTAKYGKNYTGGPGLGTGSNTAKIVRIVDPNNIFGVCSESPCFDSSIATGEGGYY